MTPSDRLIAAGNLLDRAPDSVMPREVGASLASLLLLHGSHLAPFNLHTQMVWCRDLQGAPLLAIADSLLEGAP